MKEIGYDAKKMPLGALSKENIKKGYETLKELMSILTNKKKVKPNQQKIYDLTNEF
jgi:poly [ADP-ribose] polymerase